MAVNLGALAIGALAGCGVTAAVWFGMSQGLGQEPDWLLSIEGAQAESVPNPDGTYTVMLSNVDPRVIAFTDRPIRDAEYWLTSDVIRNWPEIFKESSPNAVIAGRGSDGSYMEIPITLDSAAQEDSSLVFTVVGLSDNGSDLLSNAPVIDGPVFVFVDGCVCQLPSPG